MPPGVGVLDLATPILMVSTCWPSLNTLRVNSARSASSRHGLGAVVMSLALTQPVVPSGRTGR